MIKVVLLKHIKLRTSKPFMLLLIMDYSVADTPDVVLFLVLI